MSTQTDLAYAAGVMDADGSVCLISNKYNIAVHAYIAGQDKDLIEWLMRTFGGRTHQMGRVLAWFPPAPPHLFLEKIRPFMIVKASQVDLVLEYKQASNKGDLLYWSNRSKELNKRLPKLFPKT